MSGGIAKVAAVISVGLAVHVGVSAAATDSSGSSSSQALRGRIVIDCSGVTGVRPGRPLSGRCTATGAITDRGRFRDDAPLGTNPHGRTFFGAKGTINFSVYREHGHWKVIEGTGAYAGLRGRGWQSPTGPCGFSGRPCFVDLTMTGTAWQ